MGPMSMSSPKPAGANASPLTLYTKRRADVADVLIGCVDDLALLRVVKLVELRERAAQPDLAVRRLGQVGGHEPPGLRPVPVLDNQVGDHLSGRVEDQALDLAAVSIRAACPGPDREFHFRSHCCLPFRAAGLRHGSEPAAPRSQGVRCQP